MKTKKKNAHVASLPHDADGYPMQDGSRVTKCCGAFPEYSDADLCCRACWKPVEDEVLMNPRMPA